MIRKSSGVSRLSLAISCLSTTGKEFMPAQALPLDLMATTGGCNGFMFEEVCGALDERLMSSHGSFEGPSALRGEWLGDGSFSCAVNGTMFDWRKSAKMLNSAVMAAFFGSFFDFDRILHFVATGALGLYEASVLCLFAFL